MTIQSGNEGFRSRRFTTFFVLPTGLLASLKVWLICALSVAAVWIASLTISIIQFQSRLATARIQSSTISLERVQLLANYQNDIYERFDKLRSKRDESDAIFARLSAHGMTAIAGIDQTCRDAFPEGTDSDCFRQLYSLFIARKVIQLPELPDPLKASLKNAAVKEINLSSVNLHKLQDAFDSLRQEITGFAQP